MEDRNRGIQATPTRFLAPDGVGIAQSHCAVVVFIGDRAYKLKKPVDLGFLDFRTVAAREAACRRELVLNRRLAPDVYLDLAQVQDGRGRTCDWLVVMRRMPAARRLSTLVERGAEVRADLEQLARMLASFHSTARRGPEIDRIGGPTALHKRWTDNFAGMEPFVGEVIGRDRFDEIVELALRYLDGCASLLEDRISRRCIVDGHGDLLAEDIFCLADGPRVLDCLEFDNALRCVDGLDDAAFLAMDLERLGRADLAQQFLAWYQEFSGTPAPSSLTHHYVAYRAFVRAKVACLRHAQGVGGAARTARHLTGIALRHLRAGQIRLVLVGGLPGTGKSTLAGALADRMGAVLLRTDQIRRELPGAAGLAIHAGYGRGLYEAAHVHDTYQEMLTRSRILLEHGESVVLDASWSSADERESARAVAHGTAALATELRCVAPLDITEARIADRTGDVSDATADIAAQMARHFDQWPEAARIDTSGRAGTALDEAWEALRFE
ncbi:bifunctional aminoglycoside phosphotransferase/ATP-binding protein [Saccharopolyspora sp. ASAGF58]|uniref:bifunctional aminoglycoside phosphotransferase/ATP-binding protein n=1 Tax=Saccharopolyspora sp. ASAGF58 TaxID=2719023 RepID=UPI00143FFB81|nr:bifunctional aminoglycoside phosphotransferase/ATP-binding protein [Saccharopolyspora sp. ASAGF58]QIZ38662.1 gluconate kinase [Saccharopolyspora sp. ASAGF58]